MSSHKKKSKSFEDEDKNPNILPIEIRTLVTELDKGHGYIVLDGRPCKVKSMATLRTSLQGREHWITGSDIFTGKEYMQSFLSYNTVHVPIIKKTEYSLIGIEGNFATLMDNKGNLREDLKLPTSAERGDLTEKIINAFEANQNVVVTVMAACEQEMIMDLREDY